VAAMVSWVARATPQLRRYFVYFYWIVNIGTLISYFLLAQIATNPKAFGLPGDYGFFVTFILASSALLVALASFFYARKRYILKAPEGSAVQRYFTTIRNSAAIAPQVPSPSFCRFPCAH
jgi:dipeptide/tripeptide permease